MVPYKEFRSFFSNKHSRFWRTILHKTIIPIAEKPDKDLLLEEVYNEIETGKYIPEPPRGYLNINKGCGVVRRVPVFSVKSHCVYFFCTSYLEEKLAGNRTPLTYGGWTLGGNEIRRQEEEEYGGLSGVYKEFLKRYELPDGSLMSLVETGGYHIESSFNPDAWRIYWKKFYDQLYLVSRDYDYKWVAELDVANFYDSICITKLINKIRATVDTNDSYVVDLLETFLCHWRRDQVGYQDNTVGIPQDESGDCSRILANFFLRDYDSFVANECMRHDSMYFRFADDQFIFCNSKEELREIIARGSVFLNSIGLSLNQKKVRIFSPSEFDEHFAFDWFLDLDKRQEEEMMQLYKTNRQKTKNNGISQLLYLIQMIKKIKTPKIKNEIIKLFFSDLQLDGAKISCGHYQKIYDSLSEEKKASFVQKVSGLSEDYIHNIFHYTALHFIEDNGLDASVLKKRIAALQKYFNDCKI
jgi:hypothetical protein